MSDVRPMTDEETRMMQTIISLRLENNELKDKALRFDLDAAGIEQRERADVELVELRAENERLLGRIDALCAESVSFSTQCDTLRAENERLRAELSAKQKFVDDAFAACNDTALLRRDAERYRFQRELDWRYRVEHYGASEDERAAYIDEYDANYDEAMKEKNNES